MIQEVQVTITLEVDVTRSKLDIEEFVEKALKKAIDNAYEGEYYNILVYKTVVKEEVELYKVN